MRILFLGDVVGQTGREGVMRHLPELKEKLATDVVIVNAENAASGKGLTLKMARAFFEQGVDVLTSGNHIWSQKELLTSIDQEPRLLRPLNYPQRTPGKGSYRHVLPDQRTILVANLMGNVFMNNLLDDPFLAADALLANVSLGKDVNAIFIDFHAEATSEKMAFAHCFDGRVSAVVGTHTHVPTADEQILPQGTAYQTDAGMCGDFDSVIGVKKEIALWRFLRKTPGPRFEPAEGEATVCGCLIETDDQTGLAKRIKRVQVGGRLGR